VLVLDKGRKNNWGKNQKERKKTTTINRGPEGINRGWTRQNNGKRGKENVRVLQTPGKGGKRGGEEISQQKKSEKDAHNMYGRLG